MDWIGSINTWIVAKDFIQRVLQRTDKLFCISPPPSAGLTIKTHRPLPLRHDVISSDKHADKKFAFLSQETRVDYRPREANVSRGGVCTVLLTRIFLWY